MRSSALGFILLLTLGAAAAGQEPVYTMAGQPNSQCDQRGLWWFEGGLLRWQIKDAPVPFPITTLQTLATSLFGPATAQPVPGAPGGLSFERGTGGRIALGTWLDDSSPFGFEAGGFFLFQQTPVLTIAPRLPPILGGNLPLLNTPVTSLLPGLPVNLLGTNVPVLGDLLRSLRAGITVEEETAVYGAEANGLLRVSSGEHIQFDAIAGVRFVGMMEAATLRNPTTDMLFAQFASPGSSLGNRLITENRFLGGQVGGRFEVNLNPLWFSISGKVALGTTTEKRDVAGSLFQTLGDGLSVASLLGGLSTQGSGGILNRQTTSEFAVVNELNAKAGLQIWHGLGVWVGYDFLYWSRVARVGDQFDRLPNLGGLLGQTNQRQMAGMDFYAYGFSAGIELHY